MNAIETLNAQLEAVINTLATIPESEQAGNAAYYLNTLAHWVVNQGVDEPLIAKIWSQEDFDGLSDEKSDDSEDGELGENQPAISRDDARAAFALIDRTHNAEIGVNWDVLRCAMEEV